MTARAATRFEGPPHPSRSRVRLGRRLLLAALGLAFLLGGCRSADAPDEATGGEGDEDAAVGFESRVYERNVVFLTPGRDSTLLATWLVQARTGPEGVDRAARGLLARSDAWEEFFDAAWTTPATRAPWRLLPHGSMRLIVGEGEALERIVFDAGSRQLHVILGETLVEWSGQRGGTFRLADGALLLAEQRVPGVVLDVSRATRADAPRTGDWALLLSGDSLQAVLHQPVARPDTVPETWSGWGRVDFRNLRWPSLTVTWSERQAFEDARRDVPVAWEVSAPDGGVEGSLRVVAAELEAVEGADAQLPVDALFLVEGTLVIRGAEHPVVGLLRHQQR